MRSSRTVAALASDWWPDSAIRGVIFTIPALPSVATLHHLPVIETSYALPVLGPFDRVVPTSTRQPLQS